MNYSAIKKRDVANGPGVRVSLFVSGCTHHCKGCFNASAWDFAAGEPFTGETEEELLEALSPPFIAGLSLLGGEPLERENQKGLLPFLRRVKEAYPQKDVWCYSGYLFDRDIRDRMLPKWEETRELLSCLDVLVDGPFIEEQKNLMLHFRGSANQRIILVQPSLASGEIVLHPLNEG